jgi:hypothetical protein
MKIFKLKYLVLSVVLSTLVSCSKDTAIETADKAAIAATDAFVFDDNYNNYVIDGKLTYDHKEISTAAKGAWNVHYDGSKNKVVISTTPAEFEKYKNSNLEFKNALAENDKAALNSSNDSKGSNAANKATVIPSGGPADVNAIYGDEHLITYIWDNGDVRHLQVFIPTAKANLNFTISTHVSKFNKLTGAAISVGVASTTYFNSVFKSDSAYTNQDAVMQNESATQTLTKTFYQLPSYAGASTSFTAGAQANCVLTNLKLFSPQSYK